MEKKEKNIKVVAVVALIVAVVGLSVAYAALSQTLKLTGTAKITDAKWDVSFVKGSVTKTGDVQFTEPTVSATSISGYDVTFKKPGDKIVYNFKIKNNGQINAKLNTYTKNTLTCTSSKQDEANALCKDIKYELKYSTGSVPTPGDLLEAGATKDLNLTLEFSSTATSMPTVPVTIGGLDVTFVYGQN